MALTGEATAPAATATGRARRPRLRLWVAGVVIVSALGMLLVQGLGNATLYFRNADEAVAQRDELGDRRFRLQGTVVGGSVREVADGVAFTIEYAGVSVDVLHRGDPPELFQPDIPVVLEGSFAGERFESDRMMVKHTSDYREEHPDRVDGDYGPAGADAPGA